MDAFGRNVYGQLGLGDTLDRSSPTRVVLLEGKDVVDVECGDRHSVALLGEVCFIAFYVFEDPL